MRGVRFVFGQGRVWELVKWVPGMPRASFEGMGIGLAFDWIRGEVRELCLDWVAWATSSGCLGCLEPQLRVASLGLVEGASPRAI
ncbi:hypothetical protein BHM03_00049027 [Ensete ventricosum]|uniref:Uncharacterized protein n=1 Tax=Ensete ventricosum TaxID=4639 RepID=A0A426ZAK4_ENSVE|nr:hypothetical protein B296_00026218 [Ensete ventricosum]RZS16943.1 hypothetical protein BHM03_00049027 [Ensete ventricosum]